MVGKRPRTSEYERKSYRQQDGERDGRASGNGFRSRYRDAALDEENQVAEEASDQLNRTKITQRMGFKDAAHLALAESRRNELKKKIIDGMPEIDLEKYRTSDEKLKEMKKKKKLRKFYEEQNDRLDDWLEVDALVYAIADDVLDSMNPDANHDGIAERSGPLDISGGKIDSFLPEETLKKREKDDKKAKWAININVLANIALLVFKLIALKFSPSLSLIASTADSALDLFCTVIVYVTNRLVSWRLDALSARFPVGRKRLEPLGILVFSVIMVVSFIQILQDSVKKLMPGGDREVAQLPAIAIAAMATNAVVKGIIGIGCYPIKTTQVQALVQDCKTDVYFNIASLLFPLIGAQLDVWWLDPAGAIVLALYVIFDWADTCMQNVTRLMGSKVDESLEKKLMYLAYRFSPVVKGFKTLTAYHAGDGVWVELDILLDEKCSLPRAHDIAETLQYCYEGMKEVDRAFVTVDYSTLGPAGHAAESG